MMLSNAPTKLSDQPAVRVVVVEDDEDDRTLLTRQLRKGKIEEHVRFFAEGKSALQFLSNLPPPPPFCDLIAIFLDLNLPGISGVNLLRKVRKMPRFKTTPVIVMTHSINPNDFEACQALNVAAFIPKPVTFAIFSEAIMRLPHFPTFAFTEPKPLTDLHPD